MKTEIWKEVYKLPLVDSFIDKHDRFRSGRILDSKSQFVFQFLNASNKSQERALAAINGTSKIGREHSVFIHEAGYISINGTKVILIRGWGNLTGTGGHRFTPEKAATVQDTFAEFIVRQLNLK